jgi:hypothetical protein
LAGKQNKNPIPLFSEKWGSYGPKHLSSSKNRKEKGGEKEPSAISFQRSAKQITSSQIEI